MPIISASKAGPIIVVYQLYAQIVAASGFRLVLATESQEIPVNRNVKVLGKLLDNFEDLRQRRAALEN